MLRYHGLRNSRKGTTLVEFAIIIGMTLTLLFAIFDYSRFVMIRHLMDNAAREGARMAIAGTNSTTTTQVQDRVRTALANQPLDDLDIQVFEANASGSNIGAWTDAAFGKRIAVQIDGKYNAMLPSFGFLPKPVTLRAKSVMRSEGN